MQKTLLLFSLFCIAFKATAQNIVVVGDCTVTYTISGGDAGTNKNLAGATKTLYIKGKMSRVDLNSPGFNQSVIYDNKTGSAVVLKEVGSEKYKSVFKPDQWKNENRRFDGLKIIPANEKKTILGYDCKKVIATLKDGSSYSMYYALAIAPSATENPFQFKDIPGFVLEYETSSGTDASKIIYTATMINFNPVPASKFEIPVTGYRLLE
jgi:GLPGLI family protein